MTEMQRQFEEWALSQKWCINKTGDTYNNTYVGCSWQAWQASRAVIVVKLPSFFSDRYESEICFTDEVEKSLDNEGVSYD